MSKSSWGVCLAAAVAAVAGSNVCHAASSFDGSWSVSVVSQYGHCESNANGANYAIRVENGRVNYDSGGAVISGQVDERGNIRVSIRHGGHGASGSGHLSGTRGGGTWRGQRSAIMCSGRWEAQRL